MITEQNRIMALAQYLGEDADNFSATAIDECLINGNNEYLVCTDSEANEKAKEYIQDSLWAFNANFIIGQCDLDLSAAESLKKFQESACEGANEFILAVINGTCGLQRFVDAAISADGRGHFLASYDGHENSFSMEIDDEHADDAELETEFYIYRVN